MKKVILQPPKAKKEVTTFVKHEDKRIDPYHWMRLSDEQKDKGASDEKTKEVLDYLEEENAYFKNQMADTVDLHQNLF